MRKTLVFIIVILITSDFTSGKSIGDKKLAKRQPRSAQGVYLQEPGLGYGYDYGYNKGFSSFQPDWNRFGSEPVFSDYPYEAGVYYNYPHHRHNDQSGLGSVNRLYPYGGYAYQGYPSVGQYPVSFQPSYSPGYASGGVTGASGVPGVPGVPGIPGVEGPTTTPVPFIPTHWSSTPAPLPNNFYNNFDRQPGLLHNPSTLRPNVLMGNRTPRPVNGVPLGVAAGKTGLDLPEPNLDWQLANRQF